MNKTTYKIHTFETFSILENVHEGGYLRMSVRGVV